MQSVKFAAGDTIITEGEDGNTAYLIVGGEVEVIIGEGAKARVVGTFGDGEVFGEMCLIEPGPRSATVKAVTDTVCTTTNYDEFFATIQERPDQAVLFMKTLVHRLREMNERMVAMDPAKRGMRERFKDWQKSFEPRENEELPAIYWSMMW